MSFDWNQYLELAVDLTQNLPQNMSDQEREARWRAAISRAYYAAFCLARNFAIRRDGFTFRRENEHAELWRHFENYDDRTRLVIYQTGYRLRGLRTRVDYHDEVKINPTEVAKALSQAREIIQALRQL